MPNGWYKPGDRVPVTGIYTARHQQHRDSHDVFASQGEEFPECRTCQNNVSFALAHAASRIEDDTGFGRGRKKTARSRNKKSAERG
jgi:hypothetical protein